MGQIITRCTFAIVLAGASAFTAAQTPRQDVRRAGQESKQAAKDTGSAVSESTKQTAHRVKRGTKHVVNRSAAATERGADKVRRKTSGQ